MSNGPVSRDMADNDAEFEESSDIAIVGMACRFPGAATPDSYWHNLRDGVESRVELSDEQLKAAGVPAELLENPNYVKSGMFLEAFDCFDAGFFGFSPLDAKILDPQHRHFLECAWEAFEDAGYDPAKVDGAVGVFAGSGHNAYMPYNLLTNPDIVNDVGFFLLRHTGNDKDFLATRASYLFDLKGPSVNVQTACSTSLVAIHMGVQSLLNGESDMVLAGGITIELPHNQGYLFKESEILSPDGHCRPFEASSKGTVFGSGVGTVILKRLDDAIADGDHIHAVIKASAINNDGAGKVSYLAPSVDGQAAAIREALELGEIDPKSVSYIECHGTGTQLGDPIEVTALTQAYGADNDRKQYCGIGSVKSNIGHTDNAAGVASLIKVVQSLKHKQLAPTLHFQKPNPAIDFANSPFFVNAELRDWISEGPRRAGVSSLGVGGTNAHIILEEAPEIDNDVADDAINRSHLLLVSARSDKALQKNCNKLAELFSEDNSLDITNVAFTLAEGRRAFGKRRFLLADDLTEAANLLDSNDTEKVFTADAPRDARDIAFMFAGGGAQYANMGRDLYHNEPVYRDAIDACCEQLKAFVDYDLKALMFPEPGNEAAAGKELEKPTRTLPALFAAQYAQAQLWLSWGVQPAALIGHSVGENTAACIAGVLSLKDALGLVALRGKLFETVPEGGMLSVSMDEHDLKPLVDEAGLDIAAINAPGFAVASGAKAKLDELESALTAKDISCQRVHINIAAHSRMLEDILKPFGDYLRSVELNEPEIPFISNHTGTWITSEQATDPEYWVTHLRNTVRFADGVGTLLEEDKYALLEVGPGRTLTSLAGMHSLRKPEHTIINSMRHPDDEQHDVRFMLQTLGTLWQGNATIVWQTYYEPAQPCRVSLPTYSFDHAKHWVEPGKSVISAGLSGVAGLGMERAESTAEALYQPVWHRTPLVATPDSEAPAPATLIIAGQSSITNAIADQLNSLANRLIWVRAGNQFSKISDSEYQLRLNNPDDYIHLVSDLAKAGTVPGAILHTLALDSTRDASLQALPQDRYKVFDSLLYLAQALGTEDISGPIKWVSLSSDNQQVAGEALKNPLQSLLLGPSRVIPREFPGYQCVVADISEQQLEDGWLHRQIALELNAPVDTASNTIAYRGKARYSLVYEKQSPAPAAPVQTKVREGGTYLITGGLGGLGLVAAAELARDARVTLILMARSKLPEREHWSTLIEQRAPEAAKLQRILDIEATGAKVIVAQGDVANPADLQQLQQAHGTVNGIVHTAGVIDDTLIQLKEMPEAAAVLKPKVEGTLALAQVFDIEALDFFVLYSSTSAFTGLAGQVDYAAANAYLDAFAHYQSGLGHCQVASINWPAWKEVGMAASIADGSADLVQAAGRPVEHPLLDRCTLENDQETVFSTLFSVEHYWLLAEHRLKGGSALIPGSGYIELARAAFCEIHGPGPVEIDHASFIVPFMVADDETKELRVVLHREGDNTQFRIESGQSDEYLEHVTGAIRRGNPVSCTTNLQTLRDRCQLGEQLFSDPDHHPHLDFGERWECLKKVSIGSHEALITLAVDEQYQPELNSFRLHPALLDMATAGAQVLMDGYSPQEEFYVPVGYGQLRFNGDMPASVYSHVTYKPPAEGNHSHDVLLFDVALYNDAGELFATITDFSMQRVAEGAISRAASISSTNDIDPTLQRTLELGISSEEGAAALRFIIDGGLAPQTTVSVYDLDGLVSELVAPFAPATVEEKPEDLHDADADPDIPAIEAVLVKHPAVATVVVRSHLDEDGSRRLIAHFHPDEWEQITVSEFRKFAKKELPADQVPQHFVEMYELPLDGEGNIDRKQLLDPLAPVDTYIAPRTSTEKQLAKIWQEVLGVDRVSLSDNFFDIGGHSLISIRVIVKAEKKFGVRLDQAKMVLLTLEQMAQDIAAQLPEQEPPAAAPEGATADSTAPTAPEPASTGTQNTTGTEDKGKKKSRIKSLFGRK